MTTILLQAQQQGGGMGMLIMMGGMFVIMYFFMIRPNMKKMKEAKKFQEELQVGQKVVTTTGIYGKILEVGEKDIVLSLDQGRMRIEKTSIAHDRKVDQD